MASRRSLHSSPAGFSYVEVLSALLLTAMLLIALNRTVGNVLEARETARAGHQSLEASRYALDRMVRAVATSHRLVVPLTENPATPHFEASRDPGVLAVTLDRVRDLNGDGVPDADNDGDGRFDEDVGKDVSNDLAAGIVGIDDDNDGVTDPADAEDDDESGASNEDRVDGIDNDGDGAVDEDPGGDMSSDGAPGLAGIDDDGDGSIDEGPAADDDEDGSVNEDWWDMVVFYLSGTTLIERTPVPWDESGGGGITGLDYVERALVDNVSGFRVERIPAPNGTAALVSLSLTTTDAAGTVGTLQTTVRVGGAL